MPEKHVVRVCNNIWWLTNEFDVLFCCTDLTLISAT